MDYALECEIPTNPRRRSRPRSHRSPPGWKPLLAVGAGGVSGSAVRYLVCELIPTEAGGWPVATLLVNLVGSLALGAFLARRQSAVTSAWSVRFWAIGVLGSLTTFSALSLEVVQLADGGQFTVLFGYLAASVAGGLGLAILGGKLAGARA